MMLSKLILAISGRSAAPNASGKRNLRARRARPQRSHRAASMPRSVTTPVRWVVRTTAPESRVTRLF
jgi:hypothetical protein